MGSSNAVQPPSLFRYGIQSSLGGRMSTSMATATGNRTALRSSMGSRARTGAGGANAEPANRPMTAVRAAGYSSAGRGLFREC